MKESDDAISVNKKYVEQLTNMGLILGEARVYLAMIQIGPSRIGKIVENLVYRNLKSTMY